jgi:glycosyltransferase involved in cell wall biosynthesis
MITAIILTFNEELHIQRCINSLKKLTDNILVVDSLSNDATLKIVKENNVKFLTRKWPGNHSDQFNWALTQLPKNTDWVIRIDADEIFDSKLIGDIKATLKRAGSEVNGITFNRRIVFQGKAIRFGGVGKNTVLRLFRFGFGFSEPKIMDEHIIVKGQIAHINGCIYDHNLNSLSWWVDKHNTYASKEAFEILKNQFQTSDTLQKKYFHYSPKIKVINFFKKSLYMKLSPRYRALFYFLFRYIFCLGILDGYKGFSFHLLQGFWYRYLVDLKTLEVQSYILENSISFKDAVSKKLGINI